MSNVGTRTKLLLGVLVLILLTVVWWLFIFGPKREAIAAANAELESAQLRQSTLQTRVAQLQEIKDNELSYMFAIGQMESSIPATPQADAFIEDMTFLADSTGVELMSITLAPPASSPDSAGFEVQVAMTVEGEFFEVLGFLYGIEALDRLVRVDSVGLTPLGPAATATATGAEILGADLTMRIFTRSAASGSGDQQDPGAGTDSGEEGA